MDWEELLVKMKACAELLYENREQEAHESLNTLIVPLNEMFQKIMGKLPEVQVHEMIRIIEDFLNAYQVGDHLALADLLYYYIPEKVEKMGI